MLIILSGKQLYIVYEIIDQELSSFVKEVQRKVGATPDPKPNPNPKSIRNQEKIKCTAGYFDQTKIAVHLWFEFERPWTLKSTENLRIKEKMLHLAFLD